MLDTHGHALGHVVRRGMQVTSSMAARQSDSPNMPDDGKQLMQLFSTGGILVMGITALAFAVLLLCIRYTLWGVVSTLAMVEEPRTQLDLQSTGDAPKFDQNGNAMDVEVAAIKEPAITSKIRGTIRHLTTRAGFASRWRGMAAYLVYLVALNFATGIVSSLFGIFGIVGQSVGGFLATPVAAIALARLSTAWVHIIISEPSTKRWYRRIPGPKTWKNTWAPILINSVCLSLTWYLPVGVLFALNIQDAERVANSPAASAAKMFLVFLVAMFSFVVLVIPSSAALVRVQASMLPEEDEAIVPFDRSFGGKVVPAIVGGSGAIGLVDAWKSFGASAKRRVLMVVLKNVAIEFGINLLMVIIFAVEIAIFVDRDAFKNGVAFMAAQ